MSKKLIFLVTGGSGGHFFPALSIKERYENEYEFLFLIDKRVSKIIDKNTINYEEILPPRYSTSALLFIKNLLKIIYSCFKIFSLYLKMRPKLIIGFGGYTTIFPIIIARVMRIKVIIHEQNAILGKANRFLRFFSDKVAISFKKTKFSTKDAVFTGMPTRCQKNYSKQKINKFVILVIGGSQGAKFFSELLPNTLNFFTKKEINRIYLIQQCRHEDEVFLEKKLFNFGVVHETANFFTDIHKKIFISDLIISRCGSSTLAEISLYNKSSFLFPLSSAVDNHQNLNAIEFKKTNDCIIFDEKKIDYSIFSTAIKKRIYYKSNQTKRIKTENTTKFKKLIDSIT